MNLVLRTYGTGATANGANLLFRSRDEKNWRIGGEFGTGNEAFQIAEDAGDGEYGGSLGTTRFHIEPGGNVGIGTTNPTFHLHVSGTGFQFQEIESTDSWAAFI